MNRAPTADESAQWERFRARIEKRVIPTAKALVLLAKLGDSMQNKVQALTGSIPAIVTTDDAVIVNEIGRRADILDRLITKVLLKTYAVRFVNGLEIVSLSEEVDGSDVYPSEEINMGIAPIIIAVGIAAVTLLIAGDQAGDRLEKKSQIEATKLQREMLKADQFMATQPGPVRSQWSAWKKDAAKQYETAMNANPVARGWIEKVLGSKGTMALVVGALALGALAAFGPPRIGRGRD